MKITKLGHACLLVEMPAPINRTALFDPGTMSDVDVDSLQYLDDIFITHMHPDHFDIELVRKLAGKFPKVRITAPQEIVDTLVQVGVGARNEAPEGVSFFESPHAHGEPLLTNYPEEIGVHYLGKLSHPGDSHTFTETMPVLALPVVAPWGSTVEAIRLAIALKPQYVIPIHDWFYHDDARDWMYERLEATLKPVGITFIKPVNGQPFTLNV